MPRGRVKEFWHLGKREVKEGLCERGGRERLE